MDVLIPGAGPVGLAMAVELARFGVSVRIVDKAAQRTDKSKALVVWSRTMELLDRSGCGGAFADAGLKVTSGHLSAGQEQLAHLSFGTVSSPHPYALMLPQSETERLLEEQLNRLGVPVERGVELVRFSQADDGVTSVLRHADGREETLQTAWLAGCDGAHSTVRHQLGKEFLGDTLPSDWMLADVHLQGLPDAIAANIMLHAEGVLATFPISETRFRVIADLGEASDGKRADPTLEEVQEVLNRRGPSGIRASDPVWLSTFRINERKVADYRTGRVFLAGDAAHVHSPAGGQGMNTGIQDACNLAWKLALVVRGVCAEEPLLESYSTERSAIGEEVVKATGRVTAFATLKGDWKQSLRNRMISLMTSFAPVRATIENMITELSIGYSDSPLNGLDAHMHGDPKVGERAPIRAGESPVGSGDIPRFALFAAPHEDSAQLLTRYSSLLESNVRAPFHDGGLWLVRPDGYVALAAKTAAWDDVAAYLDRIRSVPIGS